eukprot:COSAG05_NODE_22845_length_262_cov_0.613497_1_plen_20_part_10
MYNVHVLVATAVHVDIKARH